MLASLFQIEGKTIYGVCTGVCTDFKNWDR